MARTPCGHTQLLSLHPQCRTDVARAALAPARDLLCPNSPSLRFLWESEAYRFHRKNGRRTAYCCASPPAVPGARAPRRTRGTAIGGALHASLRSCGVRPPQSAGLVPIRYLMRASMRAVACSARSSRLPARAEAPHVATTKYLVGTTPGYYSKAPDSDPQEEDDGGD